ncbi:MAG: DUF393 domain-containing protein [Proteobacteria bacterium]|nr:DUF393 domain-containing protein [Pseudomonadota bacterium]
MPFQSAPSPPLTPELRAACARAIHVVTNDGDIVRAGRAVLYILERCGWRWRARLLALPPLVWLVELGYRVVARNRRSFARFFFRRD